MTEQIAAPERKHKHRSHRRLSRHPRRLLLVAVVVWLGALATLLVRQAALDFSRPLGTPLPKFDRPEPSPTESGPAPSVAEDENQSPEAAPGSRPKCEGPPEMILLLVGVDTTTTDYIRGLADTIRLVRYDFVTPGMSVLAVPRALWVSVPGLADYDSNLRAYFGEALDSDGEALGETGPHSMLNTSYFYGNLYGLPGGGPGVLAEALYVNLGVSVDHYAAVNMQTAAEMVDAIGGVDIAVPYDVAEFRAGTQHMTGEEVLRFARTRESDNDWYRVERQNIVLRAVWDKLMQPGNLVQVPFLVDRFLSDVQTDLSKAQITSLACLMARIKQEDVRYYSLSPETVTVSSTRQGFFILLPEEDKIAPVIEGFLTDG